MKKLCAQGLWILLGLISLQAAAQYADSDVAPVSTTDAPAQENSASADTPASTVAPPPEPVAEPAPDAPAQHEKQLSAASQEPDVVATIPVPNNAAPEPVAGAEEASPGAVRLEDVVITATKRKQSVRKIPVSITALTAEKIEEMGAHEIKDFIQLVPGVNSQDEIAGIARKLSIRGVGPDINTNQTVGIVMGDVPMSDPYGSYTIADPDPWDMRTVEVLKGPQGTLFGATSLAGVVRYVPNTPELGQWGGRVSADYVRVTQGGAEPTVSAALNVPVGDSIAVRAAGSFQHRPGVIDIDTAGRPFERDADDAYTRTGRVMALWQVTDKFAANLWYVQGDRGANELGYVTNANGEFVRDDAPAPSPVDNSYSLWNLDLRYNFDWVTLVSISGYQKKHSFNDADASYLIHPLAQLGLHTVHTDRNVDTHGVLQELRLVSPDAGPWTWIAGAFYSTYTADVSAHLYVYPALDVVAQILALLPAGTLPMYDPQHGLIATTTGFHPVQAYERALYGELSRSFWRDFSITLGARVYQTGVEGTNSTATMPENAVKQADKGFSPKVSLVYRPDDNLMVYATVSRGFQYGGFNLQLATPVPPTFKSSTLWNHEIGIRTDWLDRTLRFDLTALYLRLVNPQIYLASADHLTGYVGNVGGGRSVGAETTLRYITPLPGLSVETSASYIKSTSTEPFTTQTGQYIPPGSELPSSPKLQTVTTLAYGHAFGAWQGQAAVIYSYQDKAWNNIQHDVRVGGYGLLHASLGVSRPDLPLAPNLSLSANNLLNVDKLTSALGGADTFPDYPAFSEKYTTPRLRVYTAPRSLRLNLSVQF